MSAPAWSSRPETPPRSPPRCAACTAIHRCARASAPPRARPSSPTRRPPGRPRCRARSPRHGAASVNSPMRRTIFLALLATVLLLPSAARASDTDAIVRDCATDSKLDGHYTVAELRKALDHLPKDVDEY